MQADRPSMPNSASRSSKTVRPSVQTSRSPGATRRVTVVLRAAHQSERKAGRQPTIHTIHGAWR